MPDPTTAPATDQTNPADAGHTTTEYKIARALIIALGVLAGLTVAFAGIHTAMPDAGWAATGFTLVSSIGAAALLGVRYLSNRSDVTVALANLEAARAVAGGKQDVVVEGALVGGQNRQLQARLPPSP
jgi:hypothetical protein